MPPPSVDRANTAVLDVNGGTVEVAGVCAEGDNCLRYHCRACGSYWLNDPTHACRTGRPSPRDLEQTISNWVDEQLKRGDDLATSATKVLRRVKDAGLGEALLDNFGDRLITWLWREEQELPARGPVTGAKATNGVHRATSHAVMSSRTRADRAERVTNRQPGTRRVDLDQLKSNEAVLETLLQVDGEWVRLGDLHKHQCQALQRKYEREAGVARARALTFGRLADELADDQTVRERWSVQQLEALIGDTLDAAPAAA